MTAPNVPTDEELEGLLDVDFSPDGDQPDPIPEPEPEQPPVVAAPPPPVAEPAAQATTAGGLQRDAATGQFLPKSTPSSDPQAATVPTATQQQPDSGSPFRLPDGGAPFTFRVDGEDVAPKGALNFPGQGVWIPEQVWRRELQPHYLGSRNAWRQQQRDLQQRISESDRAVQTEKQIAEKIQAEVLALINSGPEGIQAWLEHYQQNAPLMRANIEKLRYQQELEAMRAQQEDVRAQAEAEALRPRLQQWLVTGVAESIKAMPELTVLGSTPEDVAELATDLWDTYGQHLFWEADEADPARGIAKGAIFVNAPVLQQILGKKAQQVQAIRDRLSRANTAAKNNAATLAPTVAPAVTRATPPATPTGTQRRRAPQRHEQETVDDIVDREFADLT